MNRSRPVKWERAEWAGWGDGVSRPGWVCELTAPVRSFFINDGKLYAMTDDSIAEITLPPEDA